jgi:anaerobic magnesium-protoporphyrin IX monomethyl ester cyclase
MRFPSILMVTPDSPSRYFGGVRAPVGVAYIEEYLNGLGFKTAGIDLTAGFTEKQLLRKLDEVKPSIVGITLMTYNYLHTYYIVRRIKEHAPEAKIILGGAHVSAIGAEALRECTQADFACSGEGELLMESLCKGDDPANIPGLHYRDGDEIKSGPAPVANLQLDKLPFPRYSNYPLNGYVSEMEIITGRGCPHQCTFCSIASIMGYRIRKRTVASVIEELEFHYSNGVRSFQIGDDNFLGNLKYARALLEAIVKMDRKDLVLRCGQGIRADKLDKDILKLMVAAGIRHVGIGVESGRDHVLKAMKKNETVEEIDRGIQLACEAGLNVTLLFVVGTPGETLDDVRASIVLAEKHPVMRAFFFNLVPFPGTELYDWVQKHKTWVQPPEQVYNRGDELKLRSLPVFETPEMPYADRVIALKLATAASRRVERRAIGKKLNFTGPLAPLLSLAVYSNKIERLLVRHRWPRRIVDRILFRRRIVPATPTAPGSM